MAQHFFSLDVQGQKEIEAREDFEHFGIEEQFVGGDFLSSLCDTCAKKDDCPIYEVDVAVSDCLYYGKPH